MPNTRSSKTSALPHGSLAEKLRHLSPKRQEIIRPWVVSGKVELHPLVLLFFILGGVEAFGFLGLFLGPVVASVLAVLFDLFREELSKDGLSGSRQPSN